MYSHAIIIDTAQYQLIQMLSLSQIQRKGNGIIPGPRRPLRIGIFQAAANTIHHHTLHRIAA